MSHETSTPQSGENNKATEQKKGSHGASSYIWAAIFALVIAGWMLSGMLKSTTANNKADQVTSDAKNKPGEANSPKAVKPFHVEVTTFTAKDRRSNLIIRGRTEFDARVEVKAEIAGVVEAVPVHRGKQVKKGEIICRIENGERDAALLQAQAKLAQAEADYKANEALARKGHTAQLKLTSFKAQLDAAKAELTRAQLNIKRISIAAPFDGYVEDLPTKVGDFLNIGTACATLVSPHPLKVIGTVSEVEVNKVRVGMKAVIKLVSGIKKEGVIRFVASTADKDARTFRLEVKVNNKEAELREGLTADIDIPLQLTKAHQFSPAILVLNDEGQIGLRTIDEKNKVVFMPVQILSDSAEGVWVAGLPETVKVITAGQEYVGHGQIVRVTEKKTVKEQQVGQGS